MYKNIILITIVAVLSIMTQAFLKKGLQTIGELKIGSLHDLGIIGLKLIQNKFIIIGLFTAAGGVFLWLTIISRLNLTTAFPIVSGIVFILLFLISWIFLGEVITVQKIIGAVAILFGIFMILK